MSDDTISRRAAIDALWKALFEYEDKTEKQFQESDELDVSEWIAHRIFVQNMSDIDRQTIRNLPSAQPEQQWTSCSEGIPKKTDYYICTCHDGACYRTSVLKWSTGWVLTGARAYWKVIAWMPLPEPYMRDRK